MGKVYYSTHVIYRCDACTHSHTYCTHAQCTHTHLCMYLHTHLYSCTHARMHARARAHTHTHTHTHRRLHAVCVCDTADYFYHFVDRELEQYGVKPSRDGKPLSSRDLVSIVDRYKGLGYGQNTEEELGTVYTMHIVHTYVK